MNSRELFTALVIQKDLLTAGDIKIIIMLNPSDKYEGDFFFSFQCCSVFFFSLVSTYVFCNKKCVFKKKKRKAKKVMCMLRVIKCRA